MSRCRFLSIIWIVLLLFSQTGTQVKAAPSFNAYDLIDGVNQLRAQYGLAPYQVNSILMGTAQGQSDWQASIGDVTHDGPGGSRPRDRAIAAGYGGGGTVFISENIAGGIGLTVAKVISWWQGDELHLNTMLGPNYKDAGAGIANSGGFVYITLDVGYYIGGSGNPPAPTLFPGTPAPYINPVQTVTPAADGSIIIVVQSGQALWSIAIAYGVTTAYIKELNGLTSDDIYVGQKLIIRLAFTPTPTGRVTPVVITNTPRPTQKPTATFVPPTLTPTLDLTQLPSPSAQAIKPGMNQAGKISLDPLLIGIIAVGVFGLILTIVGSALKRKDQ